jgi:hypothetical protein
MQGVHATGVESKILLSSGWWEHSNDLSEEAKRPLSTLVLFNFSDSDPEYIDNLRFYVRTGIHEHDGCHHVIIVNRASDSPVRCPCRLHVAAWS